MSMRDCRSTAWRGVTLYEPAELVIAAKSGTPVSELVRVLAERGQELPFEPMDYRPLLGTRGGADHRRGGGDEYFGAPPHHGGRRARQPHRRPRRQRSRRGGEIGRAGDEERHGLDLVKLLAGSWGTLGFLTEVTFKVLPKTERMATLLGGASTSAAPSRRCRARWVRRSTSPARRILPGARCQGARTLVRFEGFSVSVDYRLGEVRRLLKSAGAPDILEGRGAESCGNRCGMRRSCPIIPSGRSGASPPRRRKGRISRRRSRAVARRAMVLRLGRGSVVDCDEARGRCGRAVIRTPPDIRRACDARARAGRHSAIVDVSSRRASPS